jgi:PAS domain S-box-containing protein
MGASQTPLASVGARSRSARLHGAWRAARRRGDLGRHGLVSRADDILSGILSVSSEGVVVTDEAMRILLFSRGAEAIFGYEAGEVVGQPIERLIPAPHRASHRQHTRRFAEGSQQSRRMSARSEVMGLTKQGQVLPLEVGLSRVSTPEGIIFTAIVRDLTEQRRGEAELEQAVAEAQAANRAKSAFLAAMSHEIRTPLNGVLGMAQALEMDEHDPRKLERLVVIRQSGEALLGILNDLLDLSKIEAGRLELEEAEFDLGEVVGSVHAVFVGLAASKGLELTMRLSRRSAGIYRGDPLRLRQILHNLISNAVKFTEHGRVSVMVARETGGFLRIRVRDTGIGIPPERAVRLFQKFEQADSSTSRRFGGTGLGLAICRDLATMMGGSISLSSAAGRGAVFDVVLSLPRVGAVKSRPAKLVSPLAPMVAQSMRILVAEDNMTNQLVLGTLLNQFGFDPTMVANGQEAVEAWERRRWDLILMDVQMPLMDGLTATGVIRGREAAQGQPRTPILALTANAMSHQEAEYLRAGMDGVVAKPIEVGELIGAIARIQELAVEQQAPLSACAERG